MAAVQNLHTAAGAHSTESTKVMTVQESKNRASNARRARGDSARGRRRERDRKREGEVKAEKVSPAAEKNVVGAGSSKASRAVSEMLSGASSCADMDEIFQSLADVLAAAQEESRQVCLNLFVHDSDARRGWFVCGFSTRAICGLYLYTGIAYSMHGFSLLFYNVSYSIGRAYGNTLFW